MRVKFETLHAQRLKMGNAKTDLFDEICDQQRPWTASGSVRSCHDLWRPHKWKLRCFYSVTFIFSSTIFMIVSLNNLFAFTIPSSSYFEHFVENYFIPSNGILLFWSNPDMLLYMYLVLSNYIFNCFSEKKWHAWSNNWCWNI